MKPILMNPIVNPLFQQQKDLWMSFVACSLLAAVVLPAGLLGELALFGARQPAAGQVSRAKGELISATDRLPLMQVGLDFHAVR